jgi:pimeloyl-ACP methyl ester carboxylesterase
MAEKTIVFIHGMFFTPTCWDAWVTYYKAQGYNCITPGWPGRDKPVKTLIKNHPDPKVGQLTLKDVVEHYAAIIKKLPKKPILIGHSMGGLVAQVLLQRDLALAAIAISSGPPLGLLSLKPSFLKASMPILNPLKRTEPYYMPFEHFQYSFVHTLPLEEQKAAYENVVPESRQVGWGLFSNAAKVDFKKAHAPLLLIAGSEDRLIPASLNHANAQRYSGHSSVVAIKEFAGRTHYILGQKGWEEVAEYGANWLNTRKI